MRTPTVLGALALFCTVTLGQEMLAYMDCEYPDMYLPICGSDGKDYFNFNQLICIASKHPERNLTAQHMYPCSCHGILENDKESPVCTSKQHTFPSHAAFECVKVFTSDTETTIASDGVCQGGKVDECWAEQLPPNLWVPICGTDELTYNSLWHLLCANLQTGNNTKVKDKGPCPCKISRLYKPLCASNQVTYPNLEMFQCDQHLYNLHNVTIVREGHCEWSENVQCEDRVPQFDESISNGLCGSDGVTYLTAQQFKCVSNRKKDLKLLHDGACKISEIPKDITPQMACEIENKYPVVAPVCGSDGNTYMSIFSLWCSSANLKGLKLKKEGPCKPEENNPPPDPCTHQDKSWKPMCGTNNVTYANAMAYQCAATKTKGLLVLHPGECNSESHVCRIADETVSIDLPYICANNGNTYVNLYAFWCDKIDKPDIEVSHFDECC